MDHLCVFIILSLFNYKIPPHRVLFAQVGGDFDDVLRPCSTRRVDLQEGDYGRLVATVACLP